MHLRSTGLEGKGGKKRELDRELFTEHLCLCVHALVLRSCQHSRPSGALRKPRATILLHYTPLAGQELACSTALAGLAVSTFVSPASRSASKTWKMNTFVSVRRLSGGRVAWEHLQSTVGWLPRQCCMLFYSHFDYVDMNCSCSHALQSTGGLSMRPPNSNGSWDRNIVLHKTCTYGLRGWNCPFWSTLVTSILMELQ